MEDIKSKVECCFRLPLFPNSKTIRFNGEFFHISFKEEHEHGCCDKVFKCSKRFKILLESHKHKKTKEVGFIIVCNGELVCECINGKEEKFIETFEPICVTIVKREKKKEKHEGSEENEQKEHHNKKHCTKLFRKSVCHEEELYEFIILKSMTMK